MCRRSVASGSIKQCDGAVHLSKCEVNHKEPVRRALEFHHKQSSERGGGGFPAELGDSSQGVLVLLHRKMMPQEFYFLSSEKYSPSLFGLPLVVTVTPGHTTCQVRFGKFETRKWYGNLVAGVVPRGVRVWYVLNPICVRLYCRSCGRVCRCVYDKSPTTITAPVTLFVHIASARA